MGGNNMDLEIRNDIFNQAREWILEAGKKIRGKINDPMVIDTKANANDLVTAMDKEIELFFAEQIKRKYPEHLLLGEEGYGDDIASLDGTVWIIDPIDGTMNFVHQKKHFAISIGIFVQEVGEIGLIYDVMSNVLYSAKRNEGAYKNNLKLKPLKKNIKLEESIFSFNHNLLCESRMFDEKVIKKLVNDIRGTRLIGAAALELAYVAEGGFDGYISEELSPWDVAAGLIIVNEVGGITTRSSGDGINMLEKGTIIACNRVLYENMISNYLRVWQK